MDIYKALRELHPRVQNGLLMCDARDLKRYILASDLEGEIKPGQIFVWEPFLSHAVELTVVTRVEGDKVWSRPIDGDREVFNDESRFREAAVRSMLNDHSAKRPTGPTAIPFPWPQGGDHDHS
jgi:hypothetical protein